MKIANMTENFFTSFEQVEEIQSNFQKRHVLR